MAQRDPYKRNVNFQSNVMQNAQRNFAEFNRKVEQNRALKEKLKEQEQANSGANFVPSSITAEFDPSLNPMKSKVNEYITEFGLKHSSQLDPKSDQFDNKIAVKYNRLKSNGLELLQSMNKSMTQYGVIKKGMAEGTIDFDPDEYEKLTQKAGWIQNLDPSQLGHDIGGNITIAERDEEGNEVFNQFSNNENFDFSATIGAAKEVNYTQNFFQRMKGTDDSDPQKVLELAITMSGGRDSNDYLGMVQAQLKSKYPDATEEALDNMTKDPKYQEEANAMMTDYWGNTKVNIPKSSTPGWEKDLRKSDLTYKMLNLEGYRMGGLREDGTLSPENEASLRERINQEYASHGTRFKEAEKMFMNSIGYQNWTEEEFKEEWYQTKLRDAATPETKDAYLAAGGKVNDGEVLGSATRIEPLEGGVPNQNLIAEGRFSIAGGDSFGEGRENQVYKNPVSFTDKNGLDFMSYDLQDMQPVEYTIPAGQGALLLGAQRSFDLGKNETQVDNRSMWGAEGKGSFTPTGVFNQVPVATNPITIPGYVMLGKKEKFWSGGAKEGEEYVIPVGGAIPDEVMAYLQSKNIDLKNSVKMGNFIKGEWTQEGYGDAPTEVLMPATSQLKNTLSTQTNHNFANMTNAKYNLEQMLLNSGGGMEQLEIIANASANEYSLEMRKAAKAILLEQN